MERGSDVAMEGGRKQKLKNVNLIFQLFQGNQKKV